MFLQRLHTPSVLEVLGARRLVEDKQLPDYMPSLSNAVTTGTSQEGITCDWYHACLAVIGKAGTWTHLQDTNLLL